MIRITAHCDHEPLRKAMEKRKLNFNIAAWRDTYADEDGGDTYSIMTFEEGKTIGITMFQFMDMAIEAVGKSKYKKGFFVEASSKEGIGMFTMNYQGEYDHADWSFWYRDGAAQDIANAKLREIRKIVERD